MAFQTILLYNYCQATPLERQQNNRKGTSLILRKFLLRLTDHVLKTWVCLHPPSHQEVAATASPESPREGDFSSRQFYDNLKSLEEPETCDDKRGPIVNNTPSNYSSSLLNAQICASLATNDLEKVRAGIFPREQAEESELEIKNWLSVSSTLSHLFVSFLTQATGERHKIQTHQKQKGICKKLEFGNAWLKCLKWNVTYSNLKLTPLFLPSGFFFKPSFWEEILSLPFWYLLSTKAYACSELEVNCFCYEMINDGMLNCSKFLIATDIDVFVLKIVELYQCFLR